MPEIKFDHVDDPAAAENAVNGIAERAAQYGRHAKQLEALAEPFFPNHDADDGDKHGKHEQEEPRMTLQHRPGRAGIFGVGEAEET